MSNDSQRDAIYASPPADSTADEAPFEFSEAVARVFPDMLRRSIPGYEESLNAIARLTRRYARPASRCYDLGCSLGAATLAMRHNIQVDDCDIIAIDNAPAMVERCRQIIEADTSPVPVDVALADIRDVDFQDASVIVLNYTLQFIPPGDRQGLIDRLSHALSAGGIAILSEKIAHPDPEIDAALCDLHHAFKRRQAYSELEISRKRAAIENVLIPDTLQTHEARFRAAGFSHVGVWFQHFNFLSLVAIR